MTKDDQNLTIGIVASQGLMRDGLRALAESTNKMTCVGLWEDLRTAASEIGHHKPSVLLLSFNPRADSYVVFQEALRALKSHTRPILLLDCEDSNCPMRERESGNGNGVALMSAKSCRLIPEALAPYPILPKDVPFSILRDIILTAAGGHPPASNNRNDAASSLSRRENEIGTLIARGYSNAAIAHELSLSYSTVKNYVSSILQKLALEHRTQIAVHFITSAIN